METEERRLPDRCDPETRRNRQWTGSNSAPSGTLQLTSAAPSNLGFDRVGADLVVDVLGTVQKVTIQNWYGSVGAQLSSIRASSSMLSSSQVNILIQAMTPVRGEPRIHPRRHSVRSIFRRANCRGYRRDCGSNQYLASGGVIFLCFSVNRGLLCPRCRLARVCPCRFLRGFVEASRRPSKNPGPADQLCSNRSQFSTDKLSYETLSVALPEGRLCQQSRHPYEVQVLSSI